jgi:hypothetical protein
MGKRIQTIHSSLLLLVRTNVPLHHHQRTINADLAHSDRADELHGKHTLFGRCMGDTVYSM